MHLINSFLFQNTPSGDDVLYTALINKANALGYTLPSANTLSALNTLIKDMRNGRIINKLDLFHVYASDGSDFFRLINIVNAEMIGTKHGGVTFTLNGVKGNGTDGYIRTGLYFGSSSFNYQVNNASLNSVVYQQAPLSQSGSPLIGLGNPLNLVDGRSVQMHNSEVVFNRINTLDSTILPGINMSGVGLISLSRNNTTEQVFTKAQDINIISSMNSTTPPVGEFSIFSRSYNNTVVYGNMGMSCAFIGGYLSYTELQYFRQVYNKYLRAIGLQQVA